MAEIWGAAIAVGGAVISGVAASKKAKQDKKDTQEMTKQGAQYNAILSQFDAEQEHYYKQLEKGEKLRGLAEFKKFSTMGNYAPTYTNDNTGPVIPERPDATTYKGLADDPAAEGSGGKKKSLLEKIDPLGSKILGAF